MERIEETLDCNSIRDIPSPEWLKSLSRHRRLTIIFDDEIAHQRESIAAAWRSQLPGFLIGDHVQKPHIYVAKLITREEVIQHQLFFEQCARDYRALATALIYQIAAQFKKIINPLAPYQSLDPYKRRKASGNIGDWQYGFHGGIMNCHCRFEHKHTRQDIQASLSYGPEFGVLDPYFFTNYIKSTSSYAPLPVAIYDNFHDGVVILNTMMALCKMERITNAFEMEGYVLTDSLPSRQL